MTDSPLPFATTDKVSQYLRSEMMCCNPQEVDREHIKRWSPLEVKPSAQGALRGRSGGAQGALSGALSGGGWVGPSVRRLSGALSEGAEWWPQWGPLWGGWVGPSVRGLSGALCEGAEWEGLSGALSGGRLWGALCEGAEWWEAVRGPLWGGWVVGGWVGPSVRGLSGGRLSGALCEGAEWEGWVGASVGGWVVDISNLMLTSSYLYSF